MPKKYKCPEPGCDRSFDKPQGLGAHRARLHGYRSNGETPVEPAEPAEPVLQPDLQADLTAGLDPQGRGSAFDGDAVLQEVFPNGVPAQTSMVQRTSELLREASELHEIAVGESATLA